MTDLFALVRDTALTLPEVAADADGAGFNVAGESFVQVRDGALRVRGADGDWIDVDVDVDTDEDPTRIEDRVARAWELAAPTALLEAGGR